MADQNLTFETRVLAADAAGIAESARLISEGLPVAVPTETVYGLAADATSGEAVARIYAAKGRPSFNPLIVHVGDVAAAELIAVLDAQARGLAERYWPGPLTMVLPVRDGAVAGLVTAGLPTVAVRVSAHPIMRAVIAAAGVPLAAPSANASGRISPTRAEHVLASLSGRIPLVLDGGATAHGLESTIVKVEGDGVSLLRPGPITAEALQAERRASTDIEAPGQLASHYAPDKPVRLNVLTAEADEWLIGFGAVAGHATLSASGNVVEAAGCLFERLHQAEAAEQPRIAITPVPEHGLGAAINDRLRRAAVRRA